MSKRLLFSMLIFLALASCVAYAVPSAVVPDVFVTSFRMDAYPALARQNNVAGDVTAVVHLAGDGTVTAITDVNGPELLRGEVDVIKTWGFIVPDRKPRAMAVILRYSLKGEPRRDASTSIKASLPYLIEITTNPAPGAVNYRRSRGIT
jgi:hypothetical protein